MNEQVLKQILDKLSSIENRLTTIEDEHAVQDRDGGRLSDCTKRFGGTLTLDQFKLLREVSLPPKEL